MGGGCVVIMTPSGLPALDEKANLMPTRSLQQARRFMPSSAAAPVIPTIRRSAHQSSPVCSAGKSHWKADKVSSRTMPISAARSWPAACGDRRRL